MSTVNSFLNIGAAAITHDIPRALGRETLARVAVKNHANGAKNPLAHIRKDLGFDYCRNVSEKNKLVAPPLKVDVLRGAKKLADGKPRLLFFWATWCAICKTALPEVLAFGQERKVEVVAISDEAPETVQPFLDSVTEPFPTLVATDRRRITFQSYGVSGLPTFVYVDAQGIVRHVQSGYTRQMGLQIDGWKWEPAQKQAAAP